MSMILTNTLIYDIIATLLIVPDIINIYICHKYIELSLMSIIFVIYVTNTPNSYLMSIIFIT